MARKLEAAGQTLLVVGMWLSVLHTFGPAAIIRVKGECVSYQAPPCPLFTFISQTVALTGHTDAQIRPTAISIVTRRTFLEKQSINIKTELPDITV